MRYSPGKNTLDAAPGQTGLAPPSLDIRIMAHPSRAAAVRALCDRLAAFDPVPAWDDAPKSAVPSAMRAARRAWGMPGRRGATHRVVLQDDVVPALDFAERLVHLLSRRPQSPVGLFAGWASRTGQAVRFAAYLGRDCAPVLGGALSGTGIALPSALADEYAAVLAEQDTDERDSVSMYDFLAARGAEPVIAVPNLVEHDSPYVPSLWAEKFVQGPRRSACYLPECETRGNGEGLGPLQALPQLSSDLLRSRAAVYHQSSGRLEVIPGWRYARQLGLETSDLLGHFSAPDIGPTRRALSGYLDDAFQYEIWLTAFLTGHGLAPLGSPGLDSPAAAAASLTMAAGCLARILSQRLLDEVTGTAADLVSHGLDAGLRAAG